MSMMRYDASNTGHTFVYRWQAISMSTTSMMWCILLDEVFQAQTTKVDCFSEYSRFCSIILILVKSSFYSDLRLLRSDTKNSAKRF